MKVNPTTSAGGGGGGDEKSLLNPAGSKSMAASQANLASLGRSNRSQRHQKKHNCNKILKQVVDGKAATVIMSLITLFALFGVRNYLSLILCLAGRFARMADN
jgi:hypothetical protein